MRFIPAVSGVQIPPLLPETHKRFGSVPDRFFVMAVSVNTAVRNAASSALWEFSILCTSRASGGGRQLPVRTSACGCSDPDRTGNRDGQPAQARLMGPSRKTGGFPAKGPSIPEHPGRILSHIRANPAKKRHSLTPSGQGGKGKRTLVTKMSPKRHSSTDLLRRKQEKDPCFPGHGPAGHAAGSFCVDP